jgi:hypothetical protein
MKLYTLEARYRSDRYDTYYVAPIDTDGYVYTNREDARQMAHLLTFMEEDGCSADVGLQGNDYPETYHVTSLTVLYPTTTLQNHANVL